MALDKTAKAELAEEVGDFLKEQTLLALSAATTPVAGASWQKRLSPAYEKEKKSLHLPPVANMELTGQMLDSFDYKVTSKGIEIGIYGEAAARADGHNNFSGDSTLPTRQFLPKEGDEYKSTIQRGVDKIIRDKQVEQLKVSRRELASIRNRDDLFSFLEELMPDFTRGQRIESILRNDDLFDLLNEFNLVRFLYGED